MNPASTGRKEKIYLTSLALATSFGSGVEAFWDGLLAGRTAFSPLTRFGNPIFSSRTAALYPGAETHGGVKEIPVFLLGLLADEAKKFPEDCELFFPCTSGEIDRLEEQNSCTGGSLLRKALKLFEKRRGHIVSAACASGNLALARAAASIRRGDRTHALVATAEYVSEFIFSGFDSLHAITLKTPKPFDRGRDGLTPGDAAGLAGLEAENHLLSRDSRPLAEIAGWGMSCDATHITAPRADGRALADAIRDALSVAGLNATDVGAVIGHGTGTVYNDAMEIAALNTVFPGGIPLLSVKGATGHTLAAAGLVQTATAVKMLRTRLIPAQTGLKNPAPGAENFVSKQVRHLEKPAVLSLNSGFGGLNSVILYRGTEA